MQRVGLLVLLVCVLHQAVALATPALDDVSGPVVAQDRPPPATLLSLPPPPDANTSMLEPRKPETVAEVRAVSFLTPVVYRHLCAGIVKALLRRCLCSDAGRRTQA